MATRFQRNEELFGEEGQSRLRGTSCAIVGVGGLGTHVIQQLALLGVRQLILIDSEELDVTNRNRYIGSRHDDPIPGSLKVDLGERLIQSVDESTLVKKVATDLVQPEGFAAVLEADWVFGCLDNEGSRWILNELCRAYARPYIDLASDINVEVRPPEFGGRVVVMPGPVGCLSCLNIVDRDEAGEDLESDASRRNRETVYGIHRATLGRSGPSVVSVNGVVASIDVTEFMSAVTGIRPPNVVSKYYGHHGRTTVSKDRPTSDCWYCKTWGRGIEAGVERYLQPAALVQKADG